MSQTERKGNTVQVKSAPQYEEALGDPGRYGNRSVEEVQEAPASKVRAARKAHHGKSTNADGSSFAEPLRKKRTSGGDGGL